MDALQLAAEIIKPFEGCHKKHPSGLIGPYLCPANIWTIGWGVTVLPDGSKVTKDTAPRTQVEVDHDFDCLLPTYAAMALKASPNLINYPRRFAAIISFVYNLGISRYNASTLRRKIKVEDWDGAVEEILKWNRAGGKVLAGLARRREAEAAFLK